MSADAVGRFKAEMKRVLAAPERRQLQAILSQFVQDQSFENLKSTLPLVLDTDEKRRALGPAIQALIPQAFQYDFGQLMERLTYPGRSASEDVETVLARQRAAHPQAYQGEGAKGQAYENWETLTGVIKKEDVELYENCKPIGLAAPPEARPPPPAAAASVPPLPRKMYKDTGAAGEVLGLSTSPPARLGDRSRSDGSRRMSGGPAAHPSTRRSSSSSGMPKPRPWIPESYMAGKISRMEAETLLQANGFSEGLFLVREKTDNGLCFVLSMVYRSKPLHLLLEKDHIGAPFKVNGDVFGNSTSVTDLIETIRVLGPNFDYQLRRPLAMADEEVAAPRGRLDSDVESKFADLDRQIAGMGI